MDTKYYEEASLLFFSHINSCSFSGAYPNSAPGGEHRPVAYLAADMDPFLTNWVRYSLDCPRAFGPHGHPGPATAAGRDWHHDAGDRDARAADLGCRPNEDSDPHRIEPGCWPTPSARPFARPTARRNRIVVRLACCCGLRVSEIAGLSMADMIVDGQRPHLRLPKTISKGKKARVVPLWWDADTLADLVAWKAERLQQGARPNDPFVCSVQAHRNGLPLQRAAIRRRFLSACKVLGRERLSCPHHPPRPAHVYQPRAGWRPHSGRGPRRGRPQQRLGDQRLPAHRGRRHRTSRQPVPLPAGRVIGGAFQPLITYFASAGPMGEAVALLRL